MAFDLKDFVGTINDTGFAYVSDFQVRITRGGPGSIARDIEFRADSVSIPGRRLMTREYKTYGAIRKIPYEPTYEDVVMSIVLSEDFAEKLYFQEWQDAIIGDHRIQGASHSQDSSFDVGYYDNYVGEVEIIQFSKTGDIVYTCNLLEAYPVGVGSLAGSCGSEDVHRLGVTISYRYFTDSNTEGGF